jgi:hypothetical protein
MRMGLLFFWLKSSELKKPSAPSAPSTHIPRWHGPYRGHSNHSIQAQQLWCSKSGLLLFGLVHIVSEVVCATKCFLNVNTQFYMCFVWMEWNGMSFKKCAWVSLFHTEKTSCTTFHISNLCPWVTSLLIPTLFFHSRRQSVIF